MSSERDGNEHGPRLDDQQKNEAAEVVGGGRPSSHEPGTSSAITPADVERRSNLAKWLSDAGYPASPTDLGAHAAQRQAPDEVLEAIGGLPDLKFHNVGEVAEALGLGIERHGW